MTHCRSLAGGALAGIALAFLAFLQLGAVEQQEPQVGTLPLGEMVQVVCTGGTGYHGQLVAQDSDWVVVKRGDRVYWTSKSQIVYVLHPVPTGNPPAER